MTEPSSWPPPPETPNLLAVHDEFLSACVRSSTPKPPVSRLRLMMRLRQKTRKDLRYCRAVVDDFCDRHTIFMPGSGLGSWLSESLPTIGCVIIFIGIAVGYFFINKEEAAVTRAAKIGFHHNLERSYFGTGGIALLLGIATVIDSIYQNKKGHADTAEAVAKFTR